MFISIRLVLIFALAIFATTVSAQNDDRGYTDLMDAPAGAVDSQVLIEALSPPRGYSFEAMAPISVGSPIFFEFGSAKLTPQSEQFVENSLVAALTSGELETFGFAIVGHTDDIGSNQYNESLSRQRAATVRDLLISKGVPAERLNAEGLGENSPRKSNSTEEGRKKNRRVEVVNAGAHES